MPPILSQSEEGPKFRIFSGALQPTADNPNRVTCTASSSVDDLHGDFMEPACVADMAAQAKAKNMLIFLNHEYKVPKDVFGQTADARSGLRGEFMDLDLDIDAVTTQKDAVDTLNLINVDKVTLGVSIGCMVEEWDYKDQAKGYEGGLRIKKVKLLEASIVGIPANQRSWTRGNRNWVRQAAMAVKTYEAAKDDKIYVLDESRDLAVQALSLSEEKDEDDGVAIDDGKQGPKSDLPMEPMDAPEPNPQPVESQPEYIPPAEEPAPHPVPDEPGHGTNKDADPNEPDALDEKPVLTEAGCPDCGGGMGSPKGDCSNSYHKSLSFADLPDSAFAVIQAGDKVDGKTPHTLRHYPHHTASGEVDIALLRQALDRSANKANIQSGKSHLLAHAQEAGIGEKTEAGWEIRVGDDVLIVRDFTANRDSHVPETYEGDAPYENCGCMTADATPEVGKDAPESGMSTSDVALTSSVEDVLVTSLSEAATEIKALRAQNAVLERALVEAVNTVEQLARMPLGRRTSAAPVISHFRQTWAGIYPDTWLKYIDEKDEKD